MGYNIKKFYYIDRIKFLILINIKKFIKFLIFDILNKN